MWCACATRGRTAITANVHAALQSQPVPLAPFQFASAMPVPLLDDAVTYDSLMVTNPSPIVSMAVGVRIAHPRVGDLALTLISPNGTRVLLDENRGGATSDMGVDLAPVSTVPASYTGGPEAVTNVYDTGATEGMLSINYSFYDLPDDMRVYYDGQLIFDSGLVSYSGATNIAYGPGASTSRHHRHERGRQYQRQHRLGLFAHLDPAQPYLSHLHRGPGPDANAHQVRLLVA